MSHPQEKPHVPEASSQKLSIRDLLESLGGNGKRPRPPQRNEAREPYPKRDVL